MLMEMVVSDVFSINKGSVSRGNAWDSIDREEEAAIGVVVELM